MKNGGDGPAKNVCTSCSPAQSLHEVASASSVTILGADPRHLQQPILHSKQSSIASNYQRGRSHPITIFTGERDLMRVKKAALTRYTPQWTPCSYSHATTAPLERPPGGGPLCLCLEIPPCMSDLASVIRSTDRKTENSKGFQGPHTASKKER
jgi:hypothetical protein